MCCSAPERALDGFAHSASLSNIAVVDAVAVLLIIPFDIGTGTQMSSLPTPKGISVVIPTINRSDVLIQTLRDLKPQTFRDFELIVIDQSDSPNSAAELLLANFSVPARYVFVTQFRGLPEARNLGWQMATKDIVVYIDDDIRCGPAFLQAHFHAHICRGAAMVAGRITSPQGDITQRGETGSFNRWTARGIANFHLSEATQCLHARGCNFSVRRAVLEELGGFDENFTVGAALHEETEFALRLARAGYLCWFEPNAHVVHLAAPMGGCRIGPDIARYMFGVAHNRAILMHRYLAPHHRFTASLRMLASGLTSCRHTGNLAPLLATIRGLRAGKALAGSIKAQTKAEEFCCPTHASLSGS